MVRHLLAAPDKFRGTASAPEAAAAIAEGARRAGWSAVLCPLADGGEGTLDAFGGPNQKSQVTGPLGAPVMADWRLDGPLAVIEMARASGLALAGGRESNDPLRASTLGTGELIAAALAAGATHVIVGVGGSATTDGGAGAIEALGGRRFADLGIGVEVACDVEIPFLDAPRVFGPQKGAGPAAITELESRLRGLAARLRAEYGVAVDELRYAGAAGGLAGGLAALGASLRSGFSLVAESVGFEAALRESDLVVTGEGRLDDTSFEGKVVGGVLERAGGLGVDHLVVAGAIAEAQRAPGRVSLVERYGEAAARDDTRSCIARSVFEHLSQDTAARS